MHATQSELQPYNWWFDTYPLEYAEFLLVTALTRGVWLHPLSANDLGFKHIDVVSDMDDQSGLITKSSTVINVDPKNTTVKSRHVIPNLKQLLKRKLAFVFAKDLKK